MSVREPLGLERRPRVVGPESDAATEEVVEPPAAASEPADAPAAEPQSAPADAPAHEPEEQAPEQPAAKPAKDPAPPRPTPEPAPSPPVESEPATTPAPSPPAASPSRGPKPPAVSTPPRATMAPSSALEPAPDVEVQWATDNPEGVAAAAAGTPRIAKPTPTRPPSPSPAGVTPPPKADHDPEPSLEERFPDIARFGRDAPDPPELSTFFRLVPILHWFLPLDHGKHWKSVSNVSANSGRELRLRHRSIWEVHTITAMLILSMNALLLFGLLTGESRATYTNAEPLTSFAWWATVVGASNVVVSFILLGSLLMGHGILSVVTDENYRAVVSSEGPTGVISRMPDYFLTAALYGMLIWWMMLLFVHVDKATAVIIVAVTSAIMVSLLMYVSYAARIIYHSGAHKTGSVFDGLPADEIPRDGGEVADLLLKRAAEDAQADMKPRSLDEQLKAWDR